LINKSFGQKPLFNQIINNPPLFVDWNGMLNKAKVILRYGLEIGFYAQNSWYQTFHT
jgi:hypothetical protein